MRSTAGQHPRTRWPRPPRAGVGVVLVVLAGLLLACDADSSGEGVAEGSAPEEPAGAAGEAPSDEGASDDHRSWSAAEDAPSEADGEGSDEAPDADEPNDPAPLEGMTIALDPGHNGANAAHPEEITRPVDAGGLEKQCNTVGAATPDGVSESEIVFALSLRLMDRLEAQGAQVSLTREDDDGWGPCIDQRGQHAQQVGAEVLVSVHADGGPPEGHGFHVIHPGEVAGYNDGLVAPSADLARDLRDALQDAGRPPATYVGTDGLHQRADIGTLNHADVPAVMVEVGNLRHPDEAALLTDDAGQETVADALAAGIVAYLEEHQPSR